MGTMRIIVAAATLCFLAAVPADTRAAAAASSGRPNIVLILTDDLDFRAMPFLPRLKSLLADQGTTFANFLVTDSLCCPSRSTILRGQYNHNHHVVSNGNDDGGYRRFHDLHEESSTIATWLQSAGYSTILLGKYLNGYPGAEGKTYVPPGWGDWYTPVDGSPYTQYDYTINDGGTRLVVKGHSDQDYLGDVLAERAAKFILRSAVSDVPFFIYLAPYSPHRPYTPPSRYQDSLAGAMAPRVASFNEQDMSDKTAWFKNLPVLSDADIAAIDDAWSKRLESMLGVEDMVARVIRALSAVGKLDNTYLFFTSDNGYHLGGHRLLPGKRTAFDEDVRVPMIVRGPGVPAGAILSHLVGNVDLAPTFAELAGAVTPDFVDGKSFAPLLVAGPPGAASFRDAFLLEHAEMGGLNADPAAVRGSLTPEGTLEPRDAFDFNTSPNSVERNVPSFTGLRTLGTIYVEYMDGEKELYDLATDPYELNNIASTASPTTLSDLASRLAALRRCAGAACR